jgi:hypothetical protein
LLLELLVFELKSINFIVYKWVEKICTWKEEEEGEANHGKY